MSHITKREIMIVFQNQWETFESFDFSNLITDADQQLAMSDIREIIKAGQYFTNSPRYQTNVNVFGQSG